MPRTTWRTKSRSEVILTRLGQRGVAQIKWLIAGIDANGRHCVILMTPPDILLPIRPGQIDAAERNQEIGSVFSAFPAKRALTPFMSLEKSASKLPAQASMTRCFLSFPTRTLVSRYFNARNGHLKRLTLVSMIPGDEADARPACQLRRLSPPTGLVQEAKRRPRPAGNSSKNCVDRSVSCVCLSGSPESGSRLLPFCGRSEQTAFGGSHRGFSFDRPLKCRHPGPCPARWRSCGLGRARPRRVGPRPVLGSHIPPFRNADPIRRFLENVPERTDGADT